jgi:ADP-ribose pyrophosphatase YjhB (NUDIX family)
VQLVPHPYGDDGQWVLSAGFKATWVSGEPTPGDDVAGFRWFSLDELEGAEFAWEHDRDLIRRALEDEG